MEFIIGEHTKRCPRCYDEIHELFESIFIEPNGQKHMLKVCYNCGAKYLVGTTKVKDRTDATLKHIEQYETVLNSMEQQEGER